MTLPRRPADVDARLAHALRRPRPRRAILDQLRAESLPGATPPDPIAVRLPGGRTAGQSMLRYRSACSGALDVRALAASCRLHPNGVRQHLAVLVDAGLVVEELDRTAGRVGRPRRLYRTATEATPVNPFERLAGLLADVAAGADPMERGRSEGAALASAFSGAEAAEVVAGIASRNGFAPTIDRAGNGTLVSLGDCPFAAIAGPIVSTLHHGIVDGAARAAGGTVTRFDVTDPAIRPCEVILAPATGASS